MALEPEPPATPTDESQDTSLAEHEAEFGDPARRPEPDPEPSPDQEPRIPKPTPDRDATGQFVKGTRHRAKSQQAGPDDVPRIQELTRKLREAEAERDRLKSAPVAPAAAVQPRPSQGSASPPSPVATTPAQPTQAEWERYKAMPDAPALKDFQAYEDWIMATHLFIDEKRWQERDARAAAKAERDRIVDSWDRRKAEATAQYPDFKKIALDAPTAIPQGSLIDNWILEHKGGAHLLYHLQKNPQELHTLLALPMLEQVDAISLLTQRLMPPTSGRATPTGAVAPAQQVSPGPRPPTPVRTAPSRAGDEPPGDDASLAEHERVWGNRRRRA